MAHLVLSTNQVSNTDFKSSIFFKGKWDYEQHDSAFVVDIEYFELLLLHQHCMNLATLQVKNLSKRLRCRKIHAVTA